MSYDEETVSEWRGMDATLILINGFDPSKRGTVIVAHDATLRMVRQYLRDSASHLIGVCMYGVEDANTSAIGLKNVIDIFPLTTPGLDDFKKLRDLSFIEAKDLLMSDVLWHCAKMFSNCKKQLLSRTVVILSRLDEPPVVSDQKPALKRVVDLVDANIAVKLINIAEHEYKIHTFYENFMIEANKGGEFIPLKPIWDPKEVEKLMHQLTHRHLSVANLMFEIGAGVAIGVGVYNLLNKSGYSQHKKVNLEQETNVKVAVVNKTMKIETSAPDPVSMDVDLENEPKPMPVLRSEILHYKFFGGERVEFTDAERKQLNNPFGPPTMKLLGFKPASILCKEKWFIKGGQFLYPTETKLEGSTVVFKALHHACTESNVVAIVIMCTRVNSKFFLAALSPCSNPLGMDIEIGFNIIQIPLVENVRNLPPAIDDECKVTSQQKGLMKDIVKALQFDYKPEMFENPTDNSKYRAIEAIALEEKDLVPFNDSTKQSPEKFRDLPDEVFEHVFGPMFVAEKRPASSSTSVKRPKPDFQIDENELKERIKYHTVHKYSVAQLKDIVKVKMGSNAPGLTGLKKQDLVDLVYRNCA